MATQATSEASEILRRGRQRLIGAVALVLLLVVFVPMVLDSEPRPSRDIQPIPSRENAPALPPPAPAKQVAVAPARNVIPATAGTQAEAPAASPKGDPFAPKSVPPPSQVPPAAPPPAAPKLEGFAENTLGVFAILGDKDVGGVIDAMSGRIDRWYVASSVSDRAAPTAVVVDALEKRGLGKATRAFATVPSAYEAASRDAGPNDRIVVFGSFTTVAEALRSAR